MLHKSTARLKLEALEKERERLLRDIERKRLRCAAAEQVVRDAQDALYTGTEVLRASMNSMLREIHQIFTTLLRPKSRLGRTERAELRRFYREVLDALPYPEADEDTPEDPADEARAPGGSSAPPSSEDWPGSGHSREHASAAKPGEKNTSLLRALYRKLAVALHPDKARDPSESARLTSVMKEVTRAYADEDLAKLVELDRSWLAQSNADDVEDELERRAADLAEANRELRRQQRTFTARLRTLEESLPGVSWKGGRPASGAEIAATTIALLERELKQTERLRDAARELSEGRIGVSEFLMGPRNTADVPGDLMNDLLDQMFEDLLDGAAERSRATSRRKARRR